jgi:hypothetical protein
MKTTPEIASVQISGKIEVIGNKGSLVQTTAGTHTKVTVKAGEKFRLKKTLANGVNEEVVALREGETLTLQYADGTRLSLEGFYASAESSIDLSVGTNGIHTLSAADTGTLLSDGNTLIYSYNSAASLPQYAEVAAAVATDAAVSAGSAASAGAAAGTAATTATAAAVGAGAGLSTMAMVGLGAVAVGGAAVAASGGSSSGNAAAPAAPADTTAPIFTGVQAHSATKTIVLTYNETLDATNPPDPDDFDITTNGTQNAVNGVAISGNTITLTLTDPFDASDPVTVDYTDPTGDNDANAIQDTAGNDAVSLSISSGVVADGYIRGAQVWIDTNGDGVQDYNTGVVTDANGNFFLPPNTPSGSIVAIGGVNIDTGVPNTMPLRAPEGSTVINPLTTLVQAILQANPDTHVDDASASVVASLGLTAGTNLTTFDPISQGDVTAQKAAATIATIITVAATSAADGTAATTATNTIIANIATQIQTAEAAQTSLNLADSTTLSNITAGVTLSAEVESAIADASSAIQSAADLSAITTAQSVALDTIAPGAATLSATAVTSDTTPTVRIHLNTTATDGTAVVAGDNVILKVDGVQAGSATVNAAAITAGYVEIVSTPLIDGTYTLSAVVIDQVGNIGTAYPTFSLTVDTTPAEPSVINRVTADNVINLAEKTAGVTLSGTVEAGTTAVSVNGAAATVSGTTWSYSFTADDYTTMGEGAEILTVVVTAANSTTATSTQNITIDTIAPTGLAINAIATDNAINAAEKTAQNGVSITGTAEAGSTVTLTIGANKYNIASNGTWSHTLTSADYTAIGGSTTISATAKDAAGNSSTPVTRNITVDTSAPILSVGSVTSDNIINSSEKTSGVTLSGTVNAGTSTVTVNGQNATIDGTNWSYAFDTTAINAMGEGSETLTIVATDEVGNTTTRTKTINVDTLVPSLIGETTATVSENTATTIYTAVAAGAVSYTLGGTDAALFAIDPATGAIKFVTPPDYETPIDAGGDNTYNITVTATDAAGNTSTPQSLAITVENVDVTVNNVTADNIINAAEKAAGVTITGNNEPGVTSVTLNGNAATVNGTSWSYTLGTAAIAAMGEGAETLTIVSGGSTITKAIMIDTTLPTVTITDDQNGTANIAGGEILYTFTFSEPISGFTTGDITVTNGTKGVFTATSATVYTLAVTPTAGFTGNVTVDVAANIATDAAGNNNAAAPQSIQAVDMAAPTLTIGTITADNTLNAAEAAAGGAISGTTTAENGQTVSVFVDGVSMGTATVNSGTWSVPMSATVAGQLAQGNHTITANVSDAAGNPALEATRTFKVDTLIPTGTLSNATADNILNATENVPGDKTVSGTSDAEAGSTVVFKVDGNTKGTTTVNADGTWSLTYTTTGALSDGVHTRSAEITDLAGNTGVVSKTVTVDTIALAPSYTLYNGTVTVNSTTLEAGATWQYQIDGGAWTTGSGTTFDVGTSGTVSFGIRQTDVAGNVSTVSGGTAVDGNPPPNSAPYLTAPWTATGPVLYIGKGVAVNIDLQNYVYDADGDTVSITIDPTDLPTGLTLSNGIITGTTTDTAGSISVSLNDGNGGIRNETITLTAIDTPENMSYVYGSTASLNLSALTAGGAATEFFTVWDYGEIGRTIIDTDGSTWTDYKYDPSTSDYIIDEGGTFAPSNITATSFTATGDWGTENIAITDIKSVTSINGVATTGLIQATATFTTVSTPTLTTTTDWWESHHTFWIHDTENPTGRLATLTELCDSLIDNTWSTVWMNDDFQVKLVGDSSAMSGEIVAMAWDGTYNVWTDMDTGIQHTQKHLVPTDTVVGTWSLDNTYLTVTATGVATTAFKIDTLNNVILQTEIAAVGSSYSETWYYGVDFATFTATLTDVMATMVPDTTPPTAGDYNYFAQDKDQDGTYSAGDIITIHFSEPIDTSKITTQTLVLDDVNSTFGTGATVAALTPLNGYAASFEITLGSGASLASATTITVAHENVVDAAGSVASSPVVFNVVTFANQYFDVTITSATLTATTTDITAFPVGTYSDGYATITFSTTTSGTISVDGQNYALTLSGGIASATIDSVTYSYKLLGGASDGDTLVLAQTDTDLTVEMNGLPEGPPPIWSLVNTTATADAIPTSGEMTMYVTNTEYFGDTYGQDWVSANFDFTNTTITFFDILGNPETMDYTVSGTTILLEGIDFSDELTLVGVSANGYYTFEQNGTDFWDWGVASADGFTDMYAWIESRDFNLGHSGTIISTDSGYYIESFDGEQYAVDFIDTDGNTTTSEEITIDFGNSVETYSIVDNTIEVERSFHEIFTLAASNPFTYEYTTTAATHTL